jgi:hypothetical protein
MDGKKGFVAFNLFIFLLIAPAYSTFQSRTTQGASWTGQVSLQSDEIRITVKPYYLDVEEDIILGAYSTSGATPSGDGNTLEIYGTFGLPANAVIVGALIWKNDSTILKAKLKAKNNARAQYETIVDRNTAPPPKPRDPLLIEKTAANTYNLSLFPVTWGKARKLRIRYLIPQQLISNELQFSFNYSFGMQVQQYPNWFKISLKADSTLPSILFNDGQTVSTIFLPTTLLKQYSSSTMNIKLPVENRISMATTNFPEGIWEGNFLVLWAKVPDSIIIKSRDATNGTLTAVSLVINNDKAKYTFNLAGTNSGGNITFQPLMFASQSLSIWSSELQWTGFNSSGEILATYAEPMPLLESELDTALVKLYSGSNVAFSEVYTSGGLGYVFGIADLNYSLLALESDTIEQTLRVALADSGVPYLLDSEIFKPAPVAVKYNLKENALAAGNSFIQTSRNAVKITFAAVTGIKEIRITDIRGRLVSLWPRRLLEGKTFIEWDKKDWAGKNVGTGVFLISVICKDRIISRQVIILR